METTPEELRAVVERALAEDAPSGDRTTALVVPASAMCTAEILAKGDGVVAGMAAADAAFAIAAEADGCGGIDVRWRVLDGDTVHTSDVLARVSGPAWPILRAERVAINFLAHLSGVATLTHRFVESARPATVLCTRKTLPGLRALERDAVVAGGGSLHRASLSDAILVKDNHLAIAGGVVAAVRAAKRGGRPVEVEVETGEQLEEALAAGADRILLDNPTPEAVRRALARVRDPSALEVSGGISLESVHSLVEAGARVISVGRITHSAPSLDISVEVVDAG